jgi:hypothetical protein
MENKERDKWDKLSIILQPVGGLLTALAVALLGLFGSQFLEFRQATESRVRLYSELMSKREQAESDLRKDMFNSIIGSFLKPGSASSTEAELEGKLLNLELLAYNFHESLNLKPLFVHLKKESRVIQNPVKQEYLDRLDRVAREITKKQLLVLEAAGKKFDRRVDLEMLLKTSGGISLEESTLTLDHNERNFRIFVLGTNPLMKEIRVRLEIRTPKEASGEVETQIAEFWVGFFDFPMIDNKRLSDDQRCAIVLNSFDRAKSFADITLVYFPGSYASLKEKPYYQEVVRHLLPEEKEKRK